MNEPKSSPAIAATLPAGRTSKRQLVMDAGRELFFGLGYADASMDQVAQQSGASKATVYSYFPSKEALFAAVVRQSSESVFSALPPLDFDRPPTEVLSRYFETLTAIFFSREGACMCHLAVSEKRRFPENSRLIFESGPGRAMEQVRDYFEGLNARGAGRIPNPRWAADKLVTLLMPSPRDVCLSEALEPPSAEDVRRTIEFFWRGLGALDSPR